MVGAGPLARGLAVALTFVCAIAFGHAIKTPKRDRVTLSRDGIVVVCEYLVGADDARQLRAVLQNDRARIERYLISQATHFLRVSVEGKELALERSDARFSIDGGPASNFAVIVSMSASIALGTGARIVLSDRHKDRGVTVPVIVEVKDALTLEPLPPQPFVFDEHPLTLHVR